MLKGMRFTFAFLLTAILVFVFSFLIGLSISESIFGAAIGTAPILLAVLYYGFGWTAREEKHELRAIQTESQLHEIREQLRTPGWLRCWALRPIRSRPGRMPEQRRKRRTLTKRNNKTSRTAAAPDTLVSSAAILFFRPVWQKNHPPHAAKQSASARFHSPFINSTKNRRNFPKNIG